MPLWVFSYKALSESFQTIIFLCDSNCSSHFLNSLIVTYYLPEKMATPRPINTPLSTADSFACGGVAACIAVRCLMSNQRSISHLHSIALSRSLSQILQK